MPAMAARSLWETFCRMRMRPCPRSWPNASARFNSARATRPFTERKFVANSASLVAQPLREQSRHLAVEFRRRLRTCLECGAADEAELRVAQRSDRSRARPPVDHGELADDRTGSEYCEDALPACRRGDARLKQAFVDPIAAVALIPRHEQGLRGCQRDRARLGEQTVRQFRRQSGQQTFR